MAPYTDHFYFFYFCACRYIYLFLYIYSFILALSKIIRDNPDRKTLLILPFSQIKSLSHTFCRAAGLLIHGEFRKTRCFQWNIHNIHIFMTKFPFTFIKISNEQQRAYSLMSQQIWWPSSAATEKYVKKRSR